MSVCMLSFDVEDWFQVENLREVFPRESWNYQRLRVVENTHRLLDVLERYGAKATFFVLGWIAEKVPGLVKDIYSAGHEIASHGFAHELIYNQTLEEFREDIHHSKRVLEDLVGTAVLGYRAPSFSITDEAIDVLVAEGFKYDSSLFPSFYHDRYGKLATLKAERHTSVIEVQTGFCEVLIPTLSLFGKKLPWGGGGYFRVIPYSIFRVGVKRLLAEVGSYLFYLHPWEIDPYQPRIKDVRLSFRFRHYAGLKGTLSKLERLIRDFRFISIKEGLEKLGYLSPKTTKES